MSKEEYLITDTPLKALTVFAMPMILGSFFQQVYNMADSIIVGQFVGSSALAAVGACAAPVSYTHLDVYKRQSPRHPYLEVPDQAAQYLDCETAPPLRRLRRFAPKDTCIREFSAS